MFWKPRKMAFGRPYAVLNQPEIAVPSLRMMDLSRYCFAELYLRTR